MLLGPVALYITSYTRIHMHIHTDIDTLKLFAFEWPENIASQAIFAFADVWITVSFSKTPYSNGKIALLPTFSETQTHTAL